MPYEWLQSNDDTKTLHLWPYRSLPRKGMVWFIGGTAALITLPLLALLGSPVLWGILPFLVATVAAIYWALSRNYEDGEILEILVLSEGKTHLMRHGPRKQYAAWQADPHWVKVNLAAAGGPVPQYLTMKGNGREVELGAFLTPDERKTLDVELRAALRSI
jgi:uncharacterized membrane protein